MVGPYPKTTVSRHDALERLTCACIVAWLDYDNLFDGAHFSNNSYGIYADKMANVRQIASQ